MRRSARSGAHQVSHHSAHQRSLQLAPRLRTQIYVILGATWATGLLWLFFHYFVQQPGEFGAQPHPLESWWLRLHGAAAFFSMLLAGLLWGLHARPGLSRPRRRSSGIVVIVFLGLLIVSGYLLYYASGDEFRDAVRLLHWLIGLALLLPFFLHVLRAPSRAVRKRDSDKPIKRPDV